MTTATTARDNGDGDGMDGKIGKRKGPRYRFSGETSEDLSGSLRDFKEMTDGLTNRLELPSIEAMRSGAVNNPISLMRRFLVAMRSAGLPKARALRVQVWLSREIDSLWPQDSTPFRVLDERAMVAQANDELARQRYNLDRDIKSLETRITTLTEEITADLVCLGRLQRDREALR